MKDSHDRYANLEVSYLLQRMESYRGLAILTTNLKHAIDPAFLRRIRFIVDFPFPDAAHRTRIWQTVFPPETPTDGLDYVKLGRLNIPGGMIRNIALHAAYLAADENSRVLMGHLLQAARVEYAKLDRPLTSAETPRSASFLVSCSSMSATRPTLRTSSASSRSPASRPIRRASNARRSRGAPSKRR